MDKPDDLRRRFLQVGDPNSEVLYAFTLREAWNYIFSFSEKEMADITRLEGILVPLVETARNFQLDWKEPIVG